MEAQDRVERREAVGSSAQGGEEQYRKTGAKQHCMAKRQAEQNKGEGAGILDRSSRNRVAGGGRSIIPSSESNTVGSECSEKTRGEGW